MKANLLKGSITYGAVTIFSRVAAIILIPILTRLLSPDEYGALSIIITVVQLANFIVTLEVAQAVTYFFTDRERADRNWYPATGFWFSLGLYIIFILLFLLFGSLISDHIAEMHIGKPMLVSGTLLLAANGVFLFVQNQLRLEFKSKQYAAVSIGYVILISVGAIFGALYFEQRSTGVILGQAIGAGIIDIIGVVLLWHRLKIGVNVQKLKQMLKFSLPLVPAGLLLLGGQQVPKLILSIYGNLEDVGIYGLASQIAGFAGLAILGVQTAITPSILANHHLEDTPKALGKLFEDFAIVSLLFCGFLSIYAHELVLVFSTSSYASAASYIPFISFSIALNSLYIFFPGKIIRGKSAAQLYASGGGFTVAVISGFVLTSLYGIWGAAVSTVLSALTFISIWYYISQKLYALPIHWFVILKAIVITLVVCIVAAFLLPSGFLWYSLLLKAGLLALFVYLIAKEKILLLWRRYLGPKSANGS